MKCQNQPKEVIMSELVATLRETIEHHARESKTEDPSLVQAHAQAVKSLSDALATIAIAEERAA